MIMSVCVSVCVSSCLNTKAFEQEILENKIYYILKKWLFKILNLLEQCTNFEPTGKLH